jgi:hypothetical protein
MKKRARLLFYPPERGGRSVMPEGAGYAPQGCTKHGQEYLPLRVEDVPAGARFDERFDATIVFMSSCAKIRTG